MNEILNAFGIDWRLITIQVVNFSLLMVALWYFLYTPILKILSERQQKIEQGIVDAEEAEKTRASADTEKAVVLQHAHTKAGGIVDRAKAHAKEKEVAMMQVADKKVEAIIQDAEKKSKELHYKRIQEAESDITKAAILATEKFLKEKV